MKKIFIILLMMILASTAQAQNQSTKLKRGIINLTTGWIELPKNIYETSIEENIRKGLTIGTIKGIGMSFVRTGVGAYDVATFFAPVPENYRPLLLPETIFSNDINNIIDITIKEEHNDN